MNVLPHRFQRPAHRLICLLTGLSACVPLGMTLPFDTVQPDPEGRRIKPAVGWLATSPGDNATGSPDGSIAIEVGRLGTRSVLRQVRRFKIGGSAYGDSILLDRSSLRPIETWRWTPQGSYLTRYHRREVERVFTPVRGSSRRSVETMDLEPYSALGMEVLIAALPLGDGYHGMIPVAVDTVDRGWSWLHFQVQRELTLQERPDQPEHGIWIVDCDIGRDRTRLYISIDGRSVRKIERLGPDNEVLGVVRRMLLRMPDPPKHADLSLH